ncbi:MAG: PrsW family glutamic-type intramembrane protease [Anaerolineae bacterium]|nr:PrsW family glutamic-type intramembrane protease [Anaerolineae bacterium]
MAPSTPFIDDVANSPEVPAPQSQAPGEPRLLGAWRVVVLIAALGIVVLGLAGALIGLLLALLSPPGERLAGTTVSVALLALTAGLGLPLAWAAWQAMQGRPSSTFRPKSPWVLVAAFILAVAGGQAVLELGLMPSLLFPPFHVVASLVPPLVILALVARGLGGAGRWRDATLQLSSGAFLATPLAFLVEGVFLFGLVVLLVVGPMMQPGGAEMLESLAELPMDAMDSTWLQDPEALLPLVLSPGLVMAALLITAVFVPLVEELAKGVGVALMSYRLPDERQAMLWGLAGGAGFAMVEGLFNTTGSLPSWAPVIVLRVGATLLHCTAGALMGLAWQQILVRRRWGPALGLYVAAVAMHAAWNTVSIGMAFLQLGAAIPEASGISGQLAAVGTTGFVVLLVVLAAGMSLLLMVLTRRLARRGQPAGEKALAPAPPPDQVG